MEPWMFWTLLAVVLVFNIAMLVFTAFFKGYGSKKGENLATHEDIDKLVVQVKAVTQATKDIEAKISDAMWGRQKRWEIKKEAALTMIRDLSNLHDALSDTASTAAYVKRSPDPNLPHLTNIQLESSDKWSKASLAFTNSLAFAELAFDKPVTDALSAVNMTIRKVALRISKGEPEAFYDSLAATVLQMQAVTKAMREELGIEGT